MMTKLKAEDGCDGIGKLPIKSLAKGEGDGQATLDGIDAFNTISLAGCPAILAVHSSVLQRFCQ